MQILHVLTSLDPKAGGPPKAMVGLASAQAQAGDRVTVLATFGAHDSPDYADVLRQASVDVKLVGPVVTPIGWCSSLRREVAEAVSASEVVHVHGMWEQVQHSACRAASSTGIPYVIRPCGMLDPWSLRQSALRKRLFLKLRVKRNLDRAAAIHFTTPAEASNAEPLRIASPSLVEPNGIDLAEFESLPQRGVFDRLCAGLEGRPYVLFLGRLHHKKGPDLLIQAFAGAGDGGFDLVLAGPGEPTYLAELEALAGRLGLGGRVHFPGMLHGGDRVAALAEAELFCLFSYQENFGIAVLEAMAAGTAVVVSDEVALCTVVDREGVGGVVPMEPGPQAAALRAWLSDDEKRREAGGRGRTLAFQTYDWRAIATRWRGHYQTLRSRR
ncbi:MAG: glycosyltransferase [Planctomycetota bacterium]